ncbi:MAG: sugar phosphate isomerase/epimerase, partial [Treponema sp.]|jgi:D-psicose/D-tagatose/L-ribulose 3-epimerase|nr:sugar phosphate isomerase/epimerase [Treponema sp.]
MPKAAVTELVGAAKDSGLVLSGGYGPRPEENIASPDAGVVQHAFDVWKRTFDVLAMLHISVVGGGLYSYWPVNFDKPFNKEEDLKRSVDGMRKLGEIAAGYGITLGMEALNRFEGYLLNSAAEALAYVKAVGLENVKVMLDTFHMNIEEDNLIDAIKSSGPHLGHFHIGEVNRRPPRAGSRIDWPAIGRALREINYPGAVVMEPFVLRGGQVGKDIKVWRDMGSEAELDEEPRKTVTFNRETFGKKKEKTRQGDQI